MLGALAYMLKSNTSNKICGSKYVGNPLDLYICNDFSFCFLNPSPFIHDRKEGSLIEDIGPIAP